MARHPRGRADLGSRIAGGGRPVLAALVAAALAVAVVIPVGLLWQRRGERAAQQDAARVVADAWAGGRLAAVRFDGAEGSAIGARVQAVTAGLTPSTPDRPDAVRVTGVTRGAPAGSSTGTSGRSDEDVVTARLQVTWTLPGDRRWSYDTGLPLVRRDGRWRPRWTDSTVHPSLRAGQVLSVSHTRAPRADVLGSNGEILVTEQPVVVVSLAPGRTTNVPRSAELLAEVVDVDPRNLTQRARQVARTDAVEVITLRQQAYEDVEAQLRPIPGAVFRVDKRALAPSAGFARSLLGTVGPATAEIVEASRGRVRPGDVTGLSGLQLAYDERLSGRAGVAVTARSPKGSAGAADPPEVIFSEEPVAGQPLHLTLERGVQQAAEATLAGAAGPAALVAVRPSSGEVLAVANGGRGGSGYNRAMLGRYPPGSTFKIATTYALLADGLDPAAAVACPATTTVGGKRFRNAEGAALGTVPFRRDFARSCNTAFVASSRRITPQQLVDGARALGYAQPNGLGAAAFLGSVPPAKDAVGQAAAAIGQGAVLASPLAVAAASASVAAGRRVPPRLVTEPVPETDPGDPVPLAPAVVAELRSLMRAVVTEGTGEALRSVRGGAVSGKSGTAEFGTGNPPATHAWFTGYQGDLAFAVLVERGGFGSRVAAPLAADFLNRLS